MIIIIKQCKFNVCFEHLSYKYSQCDPDYVYFNCPAAKCPDGSYKCPGYLPDDEIKKLPEGEKKSNA